MQNNFCTISPHDVDYMSNPGCTNKDLLPSQHTFKMSKRKVVFFFLSQDWFTIYKACVPSLEAGQYGGGGAKKADDQLCCRRRNTSTTIEHPTTHTKAN